MRPSNQRLCARIHGRLAGFLTIVGAALATSAIPNAAAEVIWSGPVSINIPSTSTGVYLNVVTGVFNTDPALVPGWDLDPRGTSDLNFFSPTPGPDGGGEMFGPGTTYLNLTPGYGIPGGMDFTIHGLTSVNSGTPLNLNSDQNFMGFRFINEAAGNQVQYGWVQISLGATPGGQPRTILQYAYENTGAEIKMGQIPEPSSLSLLGMMAAGAMGVCAWRTRKA